MEEDNKLFERRASFFLMVPKENVVEQVVKTTIRTTIERILIQMAKT
jgi:hypothetical protein